MNKPNTTPTAPEEQHEGRGHEQSMVGMGEDELGAILVKANYVVNHPRDVITAQALAKRNVPELVAEIRCLRQASRANIEEELASVLLDTQARLEEARALEGRLNSVVALTQAFMAQVDKGAFKIAETFVPHSRPPDWYIVRLDEALAHLAMLEPPSTVAQATVPETEGGRAGIDKA